MRIFQFHNVFNDIFLFEFVSSVMKLMQQLKSVGIHNDLEFI